MSNIFPFRGIKKFYRIDAAEFYWFQKQLTEFRISTYPKGFDVGVGRG